MVSARSRVSICAVSARDVSRSSGSASTLASMVTGAPNWMITLDRKRWRVK
jgi:hypothetical protein